VNGLTGAVNIDYICAKIAGRPHAYSKQVVPCYGVAALIRWLAA